jgi:hypothetical protein
MFKPRRVITGCTEQLALADIVQTLSLGSKTACISLTFHRRQGRIWFEDGVAKHAQTDRSKGEAAFYEMVTWTSAEFVIEHDVTSKETTLDTDGMLLVMDGLRRLDESGEPPDEPGAVTFSSAATGPDRDASPDRKKTLRSEVWTRTVAFLALSLGATALILVARNLVAGAPPPRPRAPTPVVRLPAGSAPARTLEIPARPDVDGEAIQGEPVASEGDAPADGAKASAVVPRSAPAEPGIPATTDEMPVEAPEVTLTELAEVLDVMPLGMIGPLDGLLPERRDVPASYVELDARSLVEAGTLTLFVDGEEIYVRELSSAPSPTRGVFKKGRIAEEFDAQLELAAGEHELVARVELDGESNGHEQSIVLDLVPGATQTLKLVAGRKRRPISLKATERRDPAALQVEPAIDTSSLDD